MFECEMVYFNGMHLFMWAMKIRKDKNEDPQLSVWTEPTRLIRCLLYGFVDYSGKRMKLFDI